MSGWGYNNTAPTGWNNGSSNQHSSNQTWTQTNTGFNQSNNQPKRSVDWNKEVDHVFKEEIKDFANSFNNQNLSSWMK